MVVPVQPVVVVPVIPVVPVVPIYAQPQIVVQTPPVVATPVQPVVPAPVVPAPATSAEVQALRQEVERLRGLLRPSAPREDEVVASNQARVTVILPADAKLWVDNVAVPLT